jgi:dTDP-glucose 4,6-dehydratase
VEDVDVTAGNALARDLDAVLARTEPLWDALRGERVLLTGGTGFYGCWLLETFAWANDRLALGASAAVVTRRPGAFAAKAPHLAHHPAVRLIAGDVRTFVHDETFAYAIHAAAESTARLYEDRPLEMFDVIVGGTAHVLDVARRFNARGVLLASSGAVYGAQPQALPRIPESYDGAPNCTDPRWAYGEAKRAAEMVCALAMQSGGPPATIARGFAFVGPYLPIDTHFAVGNFVRDKLAGGPIHVDGDGTTVRSYLYAADLAAWLWTILFRGAPLRPYNVGSPDPISVGELANVVAGADEPHVPVRIGGRPQPAQSNARYVPDVSRARDELGLEVTVGIEEAIQQTLAWHRASFRLR